MTLRVWVLRHGDEWSAVSEMFDATMRRNALPGHVQVRDVEPRVLPAVLDELRNGVVEGCVIGAAFGESIAAACDELSADARILGAVNVVVVDNGRLIGDNTMPLGIEMGLSRHRMWPLSSSRTLILGAGRAAAATAVALSRAPAADIAVTARSREEVDGLITRVGQVAPVRVLAWDADILRGPARAAQIIVNCTRADPGTLPISLHNLASRCTVADMNFDGKPTPLLQATVSAHRRGCDGRDIYLATQMIAFGRISGVEASWEQGAAALDAAIVARSAGSGAPE